MSRLELATGAADDLLETVRYSYQKWGEVQAQLYREELELALQRLSLMPDIGARREAVAPGLRSSPAARHIAFYVQRRNGILVVRILHPRMNVEEAFDAGAWALPGAAHVDSRPARYR